MNSVYLLLGGNSGDRKKNLLTAVRFIEKNAGKIEKCSSVYETAPWGKTDQPAFLNCVIKILTEKKAEEVLHTILEIEKKMGRKRKEKWSERNIDIDILFFNSEIINEASLIVPHPFIPVRRFTLVPLCEIGGNYSHPVSGKTMNELLAVCTDTLEVKKAFKAFL